jgi:hypothetical protein
MNRILAGFRGYAADARAALTWAPVEVALGWLVAFSASWAIAVQDAGVLETWTRLGVAVAIALPIVFAASILRAAASIRPATRWAITGGALLVGAVYGGLVFRPVISEAWRSWLLLGASIALFTLTPLLQRGPAPPAAGPPWNALAAERERFWIFFQRVALRAITVYGMAILVAIGVSAAVASVDTLFDLSATDEETYLHIFAWIVIGIGTWAMAGGAPDLAAEVRLDRELALTRARRVGLYLLLPLLLVYTAILYAYMVRIAFLAELPENLVSPLVLVAGALWLAGAIALEPFHWLADGPVAARIIRFFPWLAVPLVALGIWALGIRVEQYGWTEFRYVRMAALAGLLALAVSGIARRLRGRPPILKEIPITVAALMLFAATGPWGAPATSLRSQTGRMADLAAAAEAEAAASGLAARTGRASEEEIEAGEVVRYLRDHFGMEAAERVVSAPLLARLDSLNLLWGGRRDPDARPAMVQIYANGDVANGVPNVPAGTLYRISAHEQRFMPAGGEGVRAALDGTRILFEVDGVSLVADVSALADTMVARANREHGETGGALSARAANLTLGRGEQLVRLRAAGGAGPGGADAGAAGAGAGAVILESLGIEMPVDGTAAEARIVSVTGMLVVTGEGTAVGAGSAGGASPAGSAADTAATEDATSGAANAPRPAGSPPGGR